MINPKVCPAFNKGRWYEFLLESDGTNYSITTSDLEDVALATVYLKMPVGFQIVDFKLDVHYDTEGSNTYNYSRFVATDTKQAVVLPARDKVDWVKVYVFGYFE